MTFIFSLILTFANCKILRLKITKYTSEFKKNWYLATPVMLGMLGHTFVSFVDNIMVGQIGTAQLAAV